MTGIIMPVWGGTFSITPSTTSVNEGSSVTFTVNTTNFGSGTLYWTLEAVSGAVNNSDFSSPANAVSSGGSVSISGGIGSFFVTLSNDATTEGAESFRARLRTVSTSGTIVATSSTIAINDTSISPQPQPVAPQPQPVAPQPQPQPQPQPVAPTNCADCGAPGVQGFCDGPNCVV